jgi:hypothetical protein
LSKNINFESFSDALKNPIRLKYYLLQNMANSTYMELINAVEIGNTGKFNYNIKLSLRSRKLNMSRFGLEGEIWGIRQYQINCKEAINIRGVPREPFLRFKVTIRHLSHFL